MADGVQVDNAGLTDYDVHTDERSIGGATKHIQRVDEIGGSAFATGQVTPTATAATLLAARETRKGVTFFNGTNMTVYIGPATVTTANGFELRAGAGLRILTTALIQNIVASVTGLAGVISYIEEYDS